ncbi:hypothetical protein Tco_0084603 [Tanacetum coccineum]
MKIEESLNVRFNESPLPKSSPLVDDDIIEIQMIENQIEEIKDKENGPLNKENVNIKETKDHPLEMIIGKLNERTLRSQVQNQSADIAKISKKRLKTGQTRTREQKSTQRAGRMLSKVNNGQLKSTFSQTWSTLNDKNPKNTKPVPQS